MATEPKRVTLVTDELLGYTRTGGIGTATTFLAVALARMEHDVDVLYVGDPPSATIDREWGNLYESARVRIRMLERSHEQIKPSYFARAQDVARALSGAPPDVVITQDLAAPAYSAVRLRRLGLGFDRTLFVVYCHGTRRWITDMARKVRVLPGALAVTILEQASAELADVVVAPSAYVLRWMREQGWRLPPRALVIPYLSRSVATGEPQGRVDSVSRNVERLAFFGRLEERKGLKPFAAGLSALDPALLENVELEFVGATTPAWPPERVSALLSDDARRALRRISFETDLDQPEALARLGRPGTLAVMPSLGETFSNAVYECLERGIPFISSDAGAPAELVAPEDRSRVLFEPTVEGVAGALRRALTSKDALRPVRPAFDARTAVEQWADVIGSDARSDPRMDEAPRVDVAVVARDPNDASRCRAALERQTYTGFTLIKEMSRTEALAAGDGDWIVFLDGDDLPSEALLEKLVRAQAASGADVVTCGVRVGGVAHLFLGDPGGIGVLANHYGTVGLVRRSLLGESALEGDWPLFARLVLAGAQIVSIPEVLVERPEAVEHEGAEALLVAQEVERNLPRGLRSLGRLAAGLAADAGRPAAEDPSRLRRLLMRQ